MPPIFICGTDTNVGKTLVTGALCAYLRHKKINVGMMKPLESGCLVKNKKIIPADTLFLKKMSDINEDINLINPYSFLEPLAPGIAAYRAQKSVSFSKIKNNLKILNKKYNPVFIEGAGGLLVPVSKKKTNLDLIKYLDIPVILVARLGLGTLNHTLLTLKELKAHHIPVMGVILNQTTPTKGVAEQTNPAFLKQMGVKILGILPYLKSKSPESLIASIKKQKPLSQFLNKNFT